MATNPFDKFVSKAAASTPDLKAMANEALANGFVEPAKRLFRPGATRNIQAARSEVVAAANSLLQVREEVEMLGQGASIPPQMAKSVEIATSRFNHAQSKHAYAVGKFGASIKGAARNVFGGMGFDTSKIGASAMSHHEINNAVISAFETKANIFERALSKPFRVIGNTPPWVTITAGALALVAGIGKYLGYRAEKRTERELMGKAAEAQAIAAQAAAQSQPSFKNSVSPDEWAHTQANMKGAEQPAAHTASVQAAREQVKAPEQAAAI